MEGGRGRSKGSSKGWWSILASINSGHFYYLSPQRSKAIWIMDGTWHVVRAAAVGVWSSRWRKAITITVKNCSLQQGEGGTNSLSLPSLSPSSLSSFLSFLSSHRFSATAPVGQNKTEDRAVGVWGNDAAHRSEPPAAQSKV